ncbi:MAG: BTAD domain-containing putative transcriptional regulator, partial [Acidimicrobiia bacterium]
MQFQMMGQLAVRAERGDLDLGTPKQKSVLAVLLLHANEVVATDRIIDLVWGDNPPRTADHSVQIYISELRKALSNGSAADVIDTRPPGYVINVPPDSVDTLRFERLVRDGLSAIREDDPARGRARLAQALELWTGDPLSDFVYEEFAQGYIRSLIELRLDALEALATLDLEGGDLETARDGARAAIEADSLREAPRQIMMLALYRAGRQAEALRHYSAYQELLTEELGIQPSESLRRLEERILLQDPDLHTVAAAVLEGNPYRGLRAFSEDDAPVYFGRESLVSDILHRLVNGPGFVSIVGPSGSGKSSAARAGVTPLLRAEGDTVVVFQPGSRPLWELAGALERASIGSRSTLLRRLEMDRDAVREVVERPLVLVIDQFEELFTLAEPDVAVRFAELISSAIRDHATPLRVVATLRADYYDRPLSMPSLAGVFSDSVVSVKPMTPGEIELAVVEPAGAAGVSVEPALLAQLIGDMGDEPGGLPLLQFALFQLFEQSDNRLTLAAYQRMGGMDGALTSGADQLLAELDGDGEHLAEQLMMRMIQPGRTMPTARPVSVRDLVDLGYDSVELQGVLEAFGSRRLVTFDRDGSGAAVVEMAHEYLISAWPQMERWLEKHSVDLERLQGLQSATAEWLVANRSEDYLLRGERLERYEAWLGETSLRLTKTESDYLDASVVQRQREDEAHLARSAKEESLRRSARRRLWAFGAAVAALAAAVTLLIVVLIPDPPPDVILWNETREGGFGRQVGDGFDAALESLDLTGVEFVDTVAYVDEIEAFIEQGTPLVVMTLAGLQEEEVWGLWDRHPDTQFVLIDCDAETNAQMETIPNRACIVSRHAEMGFLAGVTSALLTSTRQVGVLVGVDWPYMH